MNDNNTQPARSSRTRIELAAWDEDGSAAAFPSFAPNASVPFKLKTRARVNSRIGVDTDAKYARFCLALHHRRRYESEQNEKEKEEPEETGRRTGSERATEQGGAAEEREDQKVGAPRSRIRQKQRCEAIGYGVYVSNESLTPTTPTRRRFRAR